MDSKSPEKSPAVITKSYHENPKILRNFEKFRYCLKVDRIYFDCFSWQKSLSGNNRCKMMRSGPCISDQDRTVSRPMVA